ncbi:MAG: proline racemase family protein [Planctomycetaceae bacterium]|nr:proline racemase family protein [Planctomycetaceae bacterium]
MSRNPFREDGEPVRIIETHTGGEPTRVVISGGPDLGGGSLAEQRRVFRDKFDRFRSAVVNEPRGSDVMVGALLTEPVTPGAVAGVIYFNNVGPLQMCGHGTIGVGVALAHLGRVSAGKHLLDTSVGPVGFELHDLHTVTIENVPSYRFRRDVTVEVVGIGPVTGDIAWGGNWFFLVREDQRPLALSHLEELTDFTWKIRQALTAQNITGDDGGEIDHIELYGPPANPENSSRTFVLCPGKAYDRSPCGTGTSARLACLVADGKLRPEDVYRQESVIGTVFEGRYRQDGDRVIPLVTGTAYVNGETTFLFEERDPFRYGIR